MLTGISEPIKVSNFAIHFRSKEDDNYETFVVEGDEVVWTFTVNDLIRIPSIFRLEDRAYVLTDEFYEFLDQHNLYEQFKAPFQHKKSEDGVWQAAPGAKSIRMPNDVFLLLKLSFL